MAATIVDVQVAVTGELSAVTTGQVKVTSDTVAKGKASAAVLYCAAVSLVSIWVLAGLLKTFRHEQQIPKRYTDYTRTRNILKFTIADSNMLRSVGENCF